MLSASRIKLLTFLLIATPVSATAGAWTQKKGDLLLINTATTYTSEAFFDDNGNRQDQPTFWKVEKNLYGEYGYTDQLTIGASLFLQFLTQESSSTITTGTGGSVTTTQWVENMGLGDTKSSRATYCSNKITTCCLFNLW